MGRDDVYPVKLWNSVVDRPWTSLLDIHHPDPWHAPVAATTVFSTPDDGRRKRLTHVEWNLQLLIKKQYCPKLHLVGPLYIIDLWFMETQLYIYKNKLPLTATKQNTKVVPPSLLCNLSVTSSQKWLFQHQFLPFLITSKGVPLHTQCEHAAIHRVSHSLPNPAFL